MTYIESNRSYFNMKILTIMMFLFTCRARKRKGEGVYCPQTKEKLENGSRYAKIAKQSLEIGNIDT